VTFRHVSLMVGCALLATTCALAQSKSMTLPKSVASGSAFSIPTSGSGKATLYIIGPGQALRRDVQLGEAASFLAGTLYNAGHYLTILVSESSTDTGEFDVVPAHRPDSLGFLAKPSRLPVGVHNGISGVVYVFDAYHNLITSKMPASLELSNSSGAVQSRTVTTKNGLAWAEMDSAAKEGAAKLVARVGEISSTRVIYEVPGDPCRIVISARQDGAKLEVQTAPVRDCSGNAIPDGTIVTFTETFGDKQATVDVPLKQGIARVYMPANKGTKISVASGVVAGNEIRWAGER
jgi:hypothetical protein